RVRPDVHSFPTRRSSDLARRRRRRGWIGEVEVLERVGVGDGDFPRRWSRIEDGRRAAVLEEGGDLQLTLRAGGRTDAGIEQEARSEEHTSELQSPDHLVC